MSFLCWSRDKAGVEHVATITQLGCGSGGWAVACRCGWRLDNQPSSATARRAYDAHVAEHDAAKGEG